MFSQAEIHEMAASRKAEDRIKAADALNSSFSLLPDKEEGWKDLLRLTQDQDSYVRVGAADALGKSFSHLPDKEEGWRVLLGLAQDRDSIIRWSAVSALSTSFAFLPNKEQGWEVLLKLTQDPYSFVREVAAFALGTSFAHLPSKTEGWQDLLRLTQDPYSFVRWILADALGTSFAFLPYKIQGWQDLHRLTQDKDRDMRWIAAKALGTSFAHLSNKTEGWQDLHRLTQDSDNEVRWSAAGALGSVFHLLPDKEQGWQVLLGLARDQDCNVRTHSYHSLGRVSIFKALESKDKKSIRSELEAAVKFFERSTQEVSFFNPASFCLPFYRSYLALTFQGASEAEVQEYLAQAKAAVGRSENKKELFGAVENLARALEETQRLKERSKEQIQGDLKAYRWYCDRAAEHMAAAEEKSPGAVRLMRKCNPIIEERLEETIAGIQKTAREIRQVTLGSGTKYEAPGARIDNEAKSLSSDDPIKAFKISTRIASILRDICRDKRGHICEIVEEIEAEQELSCRLSKIELFLLYLKLNISMEAESATRNKLEEIHSDIRSMNKKLDSIIFDLSKIKIGSGDIITNLWAVRSELAKIAEMEEGFSEDIGSTSKAASPPESQIKLGNLIEAKILELEEILKTKATDEDNKTILEKLESLKPSSGWEWLGRMADLIAVFDASIKVLQFLV